MARAQDLVKQASAAGLKPVTDFFVTPGSEQIRATLERDEISSTFSEAGGIVLANACGVSRFRFSLLYCPNALCNLLKLKAVALHRDVEENRWCQEG
jgi:hypothetical protein